MVNSNYEQLIELISKSAGISTEEIERKIEAKRAKLSWLISKEGAAQIVAAELGVNFDKQIIKISQIVPGMKKINLVGQIINLFPIKEYNKNGRTGRIASFILADDTSNIRTVLWDENHIELVAKGEIINGAVIEVNNASFRNGELHLTNFSEIKNSNHTLNEVVRDRPLSPKKISECNNNEGVITRAFILNLFEPKFFLICPECKKKISENGECEGHGKIIPEKRALLNFIIDDGSNSMRAVMFSEQIKKIINQEELENHEKFNLKKQGLLGSELMISGQVRKNRIFENNELIIEDIKEIDLDKLIEELEK